LLHIGLSGGRSKTPVLNFFAGSKARLCAVKFRWTIAV
jgi:hypothetical protein